MTSARTARRVPAHAELRGKRATVMGLGLLGGGMEVARYLIARGAEVTVTDLRPAEELAESLRELNGLPIEFALGQHRTSDFLETDLVVANPAVPPSSPFLAAARGAGVEVTSETALFLEACPARVVLVTGTQGKSSTCNTLANLLRSSGFQTHLGGNIGRSLLNSLDLLGAEDVVVLELSSYQLDALPPSNSSGGAGEHRYSERVVAVCCTNVLADHLERHGSIERYEAAKFRLLELAGPSAWVVLSGEDPRTSRWQVERGKRLRYFATRRTDEELNLQDGRFRLGREVLGRTAELRLPGDFQVENTLAALGLARVIGAQPERLAGAIGTLRGLEHRLEDLGCFAGHRVWDNAISTTPDSTIAALRSLDGPLVLLCGGQAKRLPLDELVLAAHGRVRCLIAFGAASGLFARAFEAGGIRAREAGTLEEAVCLAFDELQAGEALLFSPACASFDAYRNFKDRAMAFRSALPPRAEGG